MNTARGLKAVVTGEGKKRYELGAPLATGGMGVIHRGYDCWAQRQVAHKRLRVDHEGSRPRMVAMFQREYDTLARLKHPNIVEVYDYGFDEQGPYYAMELLSGEDLSKIAPVPYREACRVLRDVASALALVHARSFVHRDVSPNNVRLTSDGVAKLIDFGALTPFGRPDEIAGTPAFIAPECLQDVALDGRADLYSLGALAYWTLTRRTAVAARSIAELATAWDEPPLAPSAHVLGIPPALDELVLSLLSKAREARPGSASEVIERLSTIGELAPEQSERKVAYGYLKHPTLVGRTEALTELRAALSASLLGRGEIIVLEAAAGLGKSALIDQLAVDAQLRGALVLRAEGGSEQGKYGIARRLIQLGARIFPDLEGSEGFRLTRAQLGGVPTRARDPIEAKESDLRTATRLRELLLRLSERSPLVILLDDAQSADDDSIGLLASLADELSQHPILLLLSRQSDGSAAASHAYEQLTSRARKVSLHSLSESELLVLINTIFGGVPNEKRVALWLHAQTGGNPAQCIDLLRMLLQRGSIRYTRGTFTLPHDIDLETGQERRLGALLSRASGLSAEAEYLFGLICLHHGSLDHEQLARASGLSARGVLLAVEQLVQRELAFQHGGDVSLRGESMRAALEQSLSVEQKQTRHRALAEAVAAHADGSLTEGLAKARHLFHAGASGELEAAELMAKLLATHGHEISVSTASVLLLEAALQVFQRRGMSELHCAPLLSALATSGFYGSIQAQEKYLRPALHALSRQCGFTLARRLRRRLGKRLSLLVGLVYALVLGLFLPRKLGRTNIKERIEDFLAAASAGMASAVMLMDLALSAEIELLLEPVEGFPEWFAPSYARAFIVATGELTRGNSLAAGRSYQRQLDRLAKPAFLLEERLREQLILGALNGKAHATLEQSSGESLKLAAELERRSQFFAPHAETLRVLYYSMRGQRHLAEQHRSRREMLALRGGISWSSACILTLSSLETAFHVHDAVALMHAHAELERMAKDAPALIKYRQLALAQLSILRGTPRKAELVLREVLEDTTEVMLRHRLIYATYAHALVQLEQFVEARTICQQHLALLSPEQQRYTSMLRAPWLALAHAEGALGHFETAAGILADRLGDAAGRQNPLELGLIQAESARLAIRRGDVAAFDEHYSAMVHAFAATGYAPLTRQCDALLSRAISTGMKPHVPEGLLWSRSALEELDGVTVQEARPTRS